MKTTKVAYLLAFALFLSSANGVLSAPDGESVDTRYFVQSTHAIWKTTFTVRHTFSEGFTADLSDWQLRLGRLAGLKITPVKKFNILVTSSDINAEIVPVLAPESSALIGPPTPKDLIQDKKVEPAPSTIADPDPASKVLKKLLAPRPAPSLAVPWGIKMIYNNSTLEKSSGGDGVNVAVLDTGVFVEHPDLVARVIGCKDFTQMGSGVKDGECEDKNGHGTHVAGIISADGGEDGLGIYGVAPESKVLAYKTCSNAAECWADDVAIAIQTAVDNGANILNISFGSDSGTPLVDDAIGYAISKGVLVIVAAGNDGPYQESIDYPARLATTIGVAAMDGGRNIPEWSSRGINSKTKARTVEGKDVEFTAPGTNIESTWKDGGYAILSGTSMSAPHIAGLAAKLWQEKEENPAEATRGLLQKISTDILPIGDDDASGFGIPAL